jgi:hypothetical protein
MARHFKMHGRDKGLRDGSGNDAGHLLAWFGSSDLDWRMRAA